jgi:hypothetical protein
LKQTVSLLILLVLALSLTGKFKPDLLEPGGFGHDDIGRIAIAARDHQSNIQVEVEAIVMRLLPDDNSGARHQKLIVELENGHTLLVSHNLDLANRVPVGVSDTIRIRGEYEWNDRGGVIHWTHHDPQGRLEGGWIELEGRKYR